MSLNELYMTDVPGAKMEVEHPATGEAMRDKDGNEAYIMLQSIESDKGVKVSNKILNENLSAMQKKKGQGLSAEKTIEQTAQMLAELTENWYLVNFEGEPVEDECTQQNAKQLFLNAKWLREQAEDFVNDLGNFTGT